NTWAPEKMNAYFARVERWQYPAGSASGHGKDGWLPTRFADVLELGREAILHLDPSIGEIAVDAVWANPEHLPIHFWDIPLSIEQRVRARVDPNDLRVHDRHGVGAIAVPMAIGANGHRAGSRERVHALKQGGRLEVRTHCHVTELIFDKEDANRV